MHCDGQVFYGSDVASLYKKLSYFLFWSGYGKRFTESITYLHQSLEKIEVPNIVIYV